MDKFNGSIETAFNQDQKKILLSLVDEIDRLKQEVGVDSGGLSVDSVIGDIMRPARELQKAKNVIREIWDSGGRLAPRSKQITIEDLFKMDVMLQKSLAKDSAFTSTDLPFLLPEVIVESMREAIEPQLVLSRLFQTISYPGRGRTLVFPSFGGVVASEIGEGMEYPESKGSFGGTTTATIGKHGVAIKVTDEVIRYSVYDVIGLHMRAAANAMARHEEELAFVQLDGDASVLLDNSSSTVRSTTGRDAAGVYNGTMTAYDFFYAWAQMFNNKGYVPNTLIMNPLGWIAFAQDPLMRQFFMQNGSGRLITLPQGKSGARVPAWGKGGLNNTQKAPNGNVLGTSWMSPPELWPGDVRVIVSPFVSYSSADNTTDIFICDGSQVGVKVLDEGLTMEQWRDPARDMQSMKWRARYGFAQLDEGRAVGKIKGVKLTRGYDFSDKISVSYNAAPFTSGASALTLDDHFDSGSYSGIPS